MQPSTLNIYLIDWKAQPGHREGDDPDRFIRREGADAFQWAIDTARPAGEVVIERLADEYTAADDVYARAEVFRRLLGVARGETDITILRQYVKLISERCGMDIVTVAKLVAGPRQPATGPTATELRARYR